MCPAQHTGKIEHETSRRIFYRSAVTRAPVRWGVPQSAGAYPSPLGRTPVRWDHRFGIALLWRAPI
jgi:hypothetical protein